MIDIGKGSVRRDYVKEDFGRMWEKIVFCVSVSLTSSFDQTNTSGNNKMDSLLALIRNHDLSKAQRQSVTYIHKYIRIITFHIV
jgi:hypothetical protein